MEERWEGFFESALMIAFSTADQLIGSFQTPLAISFHAELDKAYAASARKLDEAVRDTTIRIREAAALYNEVLKKKGEGKERESAERDFQKAAGNATSAYVRSVAEALGEGARQGGDILREFVHEAIMISERCRKSCRHGSADP